MFMGEYHHTIDEKKRLIIPSKFRMNLGESFVITRGLENCLFLYPQKEWQKIIDKLNTLPFTKKDARNFSRFFMSGATLLEFDKQGRIVIPSSLSTYANIIKNCTIIGVGERIEIWADENWNKFINDNLDNLSDIAENLFIDEV